MGALSFCAYCERVGSHDELGEILRSLRGHTTSGCIPCAFCAQGVGFAAILRSCAIAILAVGCLLTIAAPVCAQSSPSQTATPKKKKRSHKKVSSRHGQQKIDPQRAREIQEALIREHYLNGKASGVWDDASQKAMQEFQADNGWQSKTTPDSRALIKLGLGPDHEHLLNPQSAMTEPSPAHAAGVATNPSADPPSGSQPQR